MRADNYLDLVTRGYRHGLGSNTSGFSPGAAAPVIIAITSASAPATGTDRSHYE